MFKKSKTLIFILSIFSLFCFYFCGTNNNIFSYASISEPEIRNDTLDSNNFSKSLFNALVAITKQLNCNQELLVKGFDKDFFSDKYKIVPDYINNNTIEEGDDGYDEYIENVNSRNQIKNDLDNKTLDLTTGENAKYDCLKEMASISSLSGLNVLTLSNIETLIIDDNSLKEISTNNLSSLVNLKKLSIKNNFLSSFNLSNNVTKLNNLDLSNNNLSNIDISKMVYLSSYPIVNLSNNNFYNLNDIKVSQSTKLSSLDLSFNMLTNNTLQEINQFNQNVLYSGETKFLIQGLNKNNYIAGDKIIAISSGDFSDLNIKAEYSTSSAYYSNITSNLISSSQIEENGFQVLYLPAGKIKLSFCNGQININEYSFPSISQELLNNLSPKNISVKLSNIFWQMDRNGKILNDTTQKDNFIVKFLLQENSNIGNYSKVVENIKYFISINNSRESLTNEISIEKNGTYNCSCYALFDGIKSDIINVKVSKNNTTGIVLGVVCIIGIIVLSAIGYFVVRWFREGASIAPLSEKESFRLRKKQYKITEQERETQIRGLGKERYFARVENEEVLTDLNDDKKEINSYYNYNSKIENESNYDSDYINNPFEKYKNQEETKNSFDDEIISNNDSEDGEDNENL